MADKTYNEPSADYLKLEAFLQRKRDALQPTLHKLRPVGRGLMVLFWPFLWFARRYYSFFRPHLEKFAELVIGFFKEHFQIRLYAVLFVFLGFLIAWNYSPWGFTLPLLRMKGKPVYMVLVPLKFFFIYYSAVLIQCWALKDYSVLKNRTFWAKSFIYIALAGIISGLYPLPEAVKALGDNNRERHLLGSVAYKSRAILFYIPILFILKRIWDRSEPGAYYGVTFKGADFKPYFSLLLLIMPFIFLASFLPDFQRYYPLANYTRWKNALGLPPWVQVPWFELSYAFNLIAVEMMYRGSLVLGMRKDIGRAVVLPMVVVYCSIHFGKPLGETISSAFGGYILAAIALRTNNILGGFFIHVGLAWFMEVFAYLQLLRRLYL